RYSLKLPALGPKCSDDIQALDPTLTAPECVTKRVSPAPAIALRKTRDTLRISANLFTTVRPYFNDPWFGSTKAVLRNLRDQLLRNIKAKAGRSRNALQSNDGSVCLEHPGFEVDVVLNHPPHDSSLALPGAR